MRVRTFEAETFRNIDACHLTFSPGVTLIEGDNAQGKTNIVEGIYFFARGRSFRTAEERDLVAFGKEGFYLSLSFAEDGGDGRENVFSYRSYGREKRRMLNGYRITRAADMIGRFRAVLFVPDDLRMVKAGPEERRSFLNVALSQIEPSYVKYYSLYKKALENRNTLLRRVSRGEYADDGEIAAWGESMADYASYLHLYRLSYIEGLSRYAEEYQKRISDGREKMSLSYESHIPDTVRDREEVRKSYLTLLTTHTDRESAAGTTLYGIHRDDVDIRINGVSARQFASQGQQRSLVLSLKLAEGEMIKERVGEYPVYLFDDVLSELDGERRRFLIEDVTRCEGERRQIIVTSCEGRIPELHVDERIRVEGGRYLTGEINV